MAEDNVEEQTYVKGYKQKGEWRGHPQYHCDFCKYDDLNELRMRDHVINSHQMGLIEAEGRKKDRPLRATLFDANGAQIKTIAE